MIPIKTKQKSLGRLPITSDLCVFYLVYLFKAYFSVKERTEEARESRNERRRRKNDKRERWRERGRNREGKGSENGKGQRKVKEGVRGKERDS